MGLLANMREARLGEARRAEVPGWVRDVLARGLAPTPGARFPSINALVAALERDPGGARRRRLTWGAATLALSVLVGALIVEARRAPVCPSAEPELAGVWDGDRRAAMTAAFHATKAPFAEDALRGAASALDRYAGDWVKMHDDSCEATRVRGEQSNDLLDLRMACLADRRTDVRALVEQLVRADAHTAETAVLAVDALPPLAGCADVAALRAPMRLPADPQLRRRIDDVRAQLADVRAFQHAARLPDASVAAEKAAAAAKEIGYLPLEAEALEVEGTVLDDSGDEKRAITVLGEAVRAAIAGKHESVEEQAWIDLVHADASDERTAEGRAGLRSTASPSWLACRTKIAWRRSS